MSHTINVDCPECGKQGGKGWLVLFTEVVRCRTCYEAVDLSEEVYCYVEDVNKRYTRSDGSTWGYFIEDVIWVATFDGMDHLDTHFIGAIAARHFNLTTGAAVVASRVTDNGTCVEFTIELPGVDSITGYCAKTPRIFP